MVIDVIDVELFDLKLSILASEKQIAVDIKLPKESLFVGFFLSANIFFNSGTRVQMY